MRMDAAISYRCEACGYVYDPNAGDPLNGVAAKTPFEELPAEWHCPVCQARKVKFSPTR